MSGAAAFAGAWLVTWGACEAWSWLVPLPAAPFRDHMRRRGVRAAGRVVLVLGVVAAGVGWLRAGCAAVLVGAILGWLLSAGREAWRLQRRRGRAQ